jgi:hypothetical protein
MRKLILIAAISQLILLAGCRKDLIDYFNGGSNNKKYTVNFRIGGLNHNVGEPNVGFQTEPIQNYITQLGIIVYDVSTGAEVARQLQSAGDVNYGQISFSLPARNYNFVAVGSNTVFNLNRFYESPGVAPLTLPYTDAYMQWSYELPYEGEKNYRTTDTFMAKATSNITGNKTVDLIMQRQIGAIEVSFTDAPQFIAELRGEMTALKFDSGIPEFGLTRRPFFTTNTTTNGPLKLKILATNGTLWLDVDPPGVNPIAVTIPVQKNKTTKVTGSLLTEQFTFTFQ